MQRLSLSKEVSPITPLTKSELNLNKLLMPALLMPAMPEQRVQAFEKFDKGIVVSLANVNGQNVNGAARRTIEMVNELHEEPDGPVAENNYAHHSTKLVNLIQETTADYWPEKLPNAAIRFARINKGIDPHYIHALIWTSEKECQANEKNQFSFVVQVQRKRMKLTSLKDGRLNNKVTLKSTPAAVAARKKDDKRRRNQIDGRGITKKERFARSVFPCLPYLTRSDTEVISMATDKATDEATEKTMESAFQAIALSRRDSLCVPLLK